jgi:hypothetical protein
VQGLGTRYIHEIKPRSQIYNTYNAEMKERLAKLALSEVLVTELRASLLHNVTANTLLSDRVSALEVSSQIHPTRRPMTSQLIWLYQVFFL